MKVVAYCRVSTTGQQDGTSLDEQERAVRAWARAHRHRVVAVHADAVSGTAGLEARDGLADALDDVRERRAGGIVVWRLDRLARDLIVQESILREVWSGDAEVFSAASGEADLRDDPADPSRRLMRQVLGAVAEYERGMTVLRLQRGRRSKARSGGFAYGSPGYGQRAVDGALVPDDREAAAIGRMRELSAAGASLRTIADTLTAEGHRPKRSDRWHPQTVARVLRRVQDPAGPSAAAPGPGEG